MEKKPFGIKFIGWLQVFGALVVLFTISVNQDVGFNVRFAVPFIPEIIVQIVIAISSLIIAYGYLNQRKWGYWSMLIFSVAFCLISLFQALTYNSQPFIGNAFYSAFVAVYTFLNSKYFYKCAIVSN